MRSSTDAAFDPLGSSLGRAAFEAAREGLIAMAPDGTVLAMNRAFAALYGVDAQEHIGGHYTAFTRGIEVTRHDAAIGEESWVTQHALRGERVEGVVQTIRYKATGRQLVARCGAEPLFEEGRLVATIVTVEDVTESTEARQKVDAALSAAEVGVWWIDLVNAKMYGDANFARMYGLTDEEAQGGTLGRAYELMHPEDRERATNALREAAWSGKAHEIEFRVVGRDGDARWLLSRGRSELDKDGVPVRRMGSAVDISRQKEAEEALRQSGESFESLVRNSPLGVYAVDAEFRLVLLSHGAQKLFENVRPLIGRDFGDVMQSIWQEPFASEITQRFRRTLETGEPYHAPNSVAPRKDVRELESYDWKIDRACLPDGRMGVVCHFYDLSEQQRYETALRKAEERHRATLDALPVLIFHIGADLKYQYANKRFEEWFGPRPEQAIGKTVRETVGEDTFAFVAPFMQKALAGQQVEWENWTEFPRGRRYVRTTYIPTRDSEGKIVGFDVLSADRTEERIAQEALRDAKARTDAVLLSADVATWVLDVQNDRLYADRNLARFFDLPPSIAEGGPAAAYIAKIHPEDQAEVTRELGAAITQGVPYEVQYRIVATEEERWVSARGVPELDEEGRVVSLPGVVVDVTRLKQAEAALLSANQDLEGKVRERTAELQASNEALSGFMYHVAHDLRSPLRSIASTSRIVQEDFGDALPEDAHSLLVRQAQAATRLGQLIDDLLRLARLSQQTVERAPIDLTRLAREVGNESLAAHPGTRVQVEVQDGMDGWADPRLLRLALGNLIENAVKYSPEGGKVLVGLHKNGAYFVSDEGIGIDPRYFGKIFEPFQRLHTEADFAGTGIGLSNVKQVVERHGGKLWVESEPGNGATFLFTLGA